MKTNPLLCIWGHDWVCCEGYWMDNPKPVSHVWYCRNCLRFR